MGDVQAEVLLLAAGRGERLRPLTDKMPKPLVPVLGKPLIDWNLELIARSGLHRVFINLHYLGEQIEAHVGDGARYGLQVEYSREPILLDTGGAIKKIHPLLKAPFLVTVNSDILVAEDFSLQGILNAHQGDSRQPLATLALREDPQADSYGSLEIDETRRIIRFLDSELPNIEASRGKKLMYMGVQVISQHLLGKEIAAPRGQGGLLEKSSDSMSGQGEPPPEIFSITRDVYRRVVREGGMMLGYTYSGFWSDVGTPERLSRASEEMRALRGGG